MNSNENVKNILTNYKHERPAILAKLYQLLMHGTMAGSGKLVVLPVDQGFEHGPDASFSVNPAAYNPYYHPRLAIKAGLSAYAAPLGMIEAAAGEFPGEIPLILKMNSNNSLNKGEPRQVINCSIDQAIYLGCIGIGITIYPGSRYFNAMLKEIKEIINEAKNKGLLVFIWSYPRGENLKKEYETAVDVAAYAAHIAALLGAHIIKIKPPSAQVLNPENVSNINDINSLASRVQHVKQSCFNGRRLLLFSGGSAISENEIITETAVLAQGGASGSIIGRNSFKRPLDEAIKMLDKICRLYKNAAQNN